MKQRAIVAICVGVLSLASGGCLNLKKAPEVTTASKVPVLQTWAKLNAQNGGQVRDNWVTTFNDPTLDGLVRESLANNQNILAAAARRDRSLAFARRAGTALWPTLDFAFGGTAGAGKASGDTFFLGLANWELDLWGRVRYLNYASEQEFFLAQADLEFARQSIAAQVAQTYYLTVANRLRLQNSQSQLKIQEDIDRIQQTKLKEGQAGKFESELSKSDLARFRADVQDRQSAFEESLRALEVLLGRYPAADVKAAEALPALPGEVPAGLPAQLLERRPDVLAAKYAVASAFYRTESANANLFPRISLTGQGGFVHTDLNGLLNRNLATGSFGGQLVQPLFDAGARFADIEAAKASQKEALASYVNTALNAFREVQNGLANEVYFRERSAQLQSSSASMDVAQPLARQRYDAGEISLLDFKQVQTQAYQTKDQAIQAQYATIQQRIDLHRSLGGSMVPAPTPAPAPAPAAKP